MFVVWTKASKQIANMMAAAVINDIFMRLALSKATLYNISAFFPKSA